MDIVDMTFPKMRWPKLRTLYSAFQTSYSFNFPFLEWKINDS